MGFQPSPIDNRHPTAMHI